MKNLNNFFCSNNYLIKKNWKHHGGQNIFQNQCHHQPPQKKIVLKPVPPVTASPLPHEDKKTKSA